MKWTTSVLSVILVFIVSSTRGYTFGTRHVKQPSTNKVARDLKLEKFVKEEKNYYYQWRDDKFPFQVMLIGKSGLQRFLCGGTLLSREWILTAAHCTTGVYEFEVHLGAESFDNYTEPGRIIMNTSEFIVHEDYDPYFALNDIAIVRLPEKIKFTERIQPVRLPRRKDTFIGDYVIASGWGSTGAKMTSEKLEFAELKVISNKECTRYYNKFIIRGSTLCARGMNNANVCTGDSGGPLILKGTRTLIAVTSFGNAGGCEIAMPGGFSRVSWYLNWIISKTGD